MNTPTELYAPTLTERSHQEFVLSLKLLANGPVQQRVREAYAQQVLPVATEQLGRAPATRRDVALPLARTVPYRHWAVLTHATQSMMWRAIETTASRVAPEAHRRAAQLPRGSTLELDPALTVPPPIANTEIHRQPGGFTGSDQSGDLLAGLRYLGASRIYAPGKGNDVEATDARGAFLVAEVQRRFGDFAPRRILDLGCGIGVASHAIAQAFPQAEYHAVDVAGGLLRFGHLLASQRGLPLHFHQRDAAHTGFPDGHFDLVVSNILFHETNSARLPQILRECRRVLRAGGHMLHVDVPTQISRLGLADQVMNDWQVRWNGEPFWTAFAETDMLEEIVRAGFDPSRSFAEHLAKPGATTAYVFGATR